MINESLGGVLFIDEAYSLGNDDKKDIYDKITLDFFEFLKKNQALTPGTDDDLPPWINNLPENEKQSAIARKTQETFILKIKCSFDFQNKRFLGLS